MRNLSYFTLALIAAPAFAEDAPPAHHDDTPTDIIVTAPFERARADVLSGTSVLSGADLIRETRSTIGDTLTHQPGVSATSFGPNASRPVLRGFQGQRIGVLKDGIGSVDASATSVDHAVVINPLTADRIEVLRGPAALLYGSSAIGGVVNVIDSRIPRKVPDEPIHLAAQGTYGSAADERSGFAGTDVPIGQFVFHADGSYLKTGDLDTGNYILSAPLRAQAAASADPEIRDLADLRGKLPNSAARTWEAAVGGAYIGSGGNIGASYSRYDSLYGVPLRYSLDPAVEAENVRLHLKQDRVDLRAEVTPHGEVIDAIRLRAAFANYQHSEIEDTGEVGTTFFNKAIESRLEIAQARRGGWQGASGVQYLIRDFNVIGDEAFVPKNVTSQIGFFTLQSFDFSPIKAEIGARYEHSTVNADPSATIGSPAYARNFNAISGSVGASYALAAGLKLGVNFAHTERAPSAEELYANGPHAGTQAFEIGNPDFRVERSNGLELTLKGSGAGWSFSLGGYASWFTNYIYEQQTGAIQDDLPVFQSLQAKARYWGVEAEASYKVAQLGGFAINVDGVGDYTNATIPGIGPVPRIPPLRLLGGLEAQSNKLDARVEVERNFAQNRVAPVETRTPGFTLVNASVAVRPWGNDNPTSITFSANNIFDVEARRHASFLKDYAPLAGRDLRVTLRVGI